MRFFVPLIAILTWVTLTAPAQAQPQRNEGISFGWEQEVVFVADLDPDVQASLKAETGFDLAIGFAYYRAYIFGGSFALWNWNGRFVLFHGGNVFDFQEGGLAQLIGRRQASELRTPWIYHVPIGLVTLLVIGVAVGIALFVLSRGRTAVQQAFSDPRYCAALEVYQGALPAPDDETTVEHRRAALHVAGEYLVEKYQLKSEEADAKLRLVVSAFEEARSKDLRYQAALHEQAGEWEQALDLYEEAAELREMWDPKDHAFVLKCIARVEKKQGNAT